MATALGEWKGPWGKGEQGTLMHKGVNAEMTNLFKIRYEGLGKAGGSKSLELYLLQSSLHLQQQNTACEFTLEYPDLHPPSLMITVLS